MHLAQTSALLRLKKSIMCKLVRSLEKLPVEKHILDHYEFMKDYHDKKIRTRDTVKSIWYEKQTFFFMKEKEC